MSFINRIQRAGKKTTRLGCALSLTLGLMQSATQAATITVTGTGDAIAVDGLVTLREAITSANNNANVNADVVPIGAYGNDTINFAIPGVGVHTITLSSALPTITDPVVIDGYSQSGATANTLATADNAHLVIEITSTNHSPGLLITGGNSTVRGLVINGLNTAIQLSSLGGNVVEGNFVGTDPTGTMNQGNIGMGVRTITNSGSNTIGGTTPAARNVIAGNDNVGVGLQSDANVVQGNFIGLDTTGTNPIGNSHGILIFSDGNLIGGDVAGAGNVIAGNNGHGLNMSSVSANVVKGNLIGTDAAGTHARPNTNNGINLGGISSNNIFGGTTPAARNVISGNTGDGVAIGAPNNVVQGNFIGTDITGTVDLGNTGDGVSLGVGTVNNVVGGGAAGAGNLISGNTGFGINIGGAGSGTTMQGNRIGTDVTGTQALGNSRAGVRIFNSKANLIGGPNSGEGNVIAFNGEQGITIEGDNDINNAVLGNSIFSNSGLGIDLHFDGPTLNDTGDADTGMNNLQNFPVLTSVTNSGGMTTIAGRLNSAASTTYRIEFFANDAIDSSGYGEGKTFIGFKDVTTSAGGNANFNSMFPQIAAGQRVTATATDPDGNTSEFSGTIGQLLNISTRMEVLTGNNALIGGFIIGGSGSKEVLLRALGPTLGNFGVTGFVGDPTLDLFDGSGNLIMSNDNWKDAQQAAINATGKAPPNDMESAIRHTLTPGNYTAIVRGKSNTTGIGLVEAYDLDEAISPALTNISTRGFVDIGQNVMIGGFISGHGIVRVIVRALGPTLSVFGVPNVLADPMLEVHDAQGILLTSNDNWKDSQQAEIQASGKAPPNDNESAIIVVRPATNTTAVVRGKNNTTGNALVEAYVLPP